LPGNEIMVSKIIIYSLEIMLTQHPTNRTEMNKEGMEGGRRK
jgi:hypothetical protein